MMALTDSKQGRRPRRVPKASLVPRVPAPAPRPPIWVMGGHKGGVGKSLAAVFVAAEACERDLNVLLIDADPQGTVRGWARAGGHHHRLIIGVDYCANPRQGDFAVNVAALAQGAALQPIPGTDEQFDLAVVDLSPKMGEIQAYAALASSVFLVPCAPAGPEGWAIDDTLSLLRDVLRVRETFRPRLLIARTRHTKVARLVRPRLDHLTLAPPWDPSVPYQAGDLVLWDGRILSCLAAHEPEDPAEPRADHWQVQPWGELLEGKLPLLRTSLGERADHAEAMFVGAGVTAYAPRSVAAQEVRDLFDELWQLTAGPLPKGPGSGPALGEGAGR